jgi:hypothetical protein
MSFRNKPRKKRSVLWTIEKEHLQLIASQSNSIAEMLRNLGVFTQGANRNTLIRRMSEDQIDYSHMAFGLDSNKGRKFGEHKSALTNEETFIADSLTTRAVVRKKLISRNLIPYQCQECGCDNQWKGKKLSLVLDHINGISNDHRLDNLRFLCPNCNSQTDTFCGRNIKF